MKVGRAAASAPRRSARGTVADTALTAAYDTIRQDLLGGRYEPGAKLRIEALCARYGFGASPIREALSRISESGLIVAVPQRGYRVAAVSLAEYRELVDMRLTLEPEALARSIARADIDWEARVAAAFHRLTSMHRLLRTKAPDGFRNWAREDRAFHLALIANCGSDWLLKFCGAVFDQTARYHRERILDGVAPVRDTENEHKALLEAVLEHDAKAATHLLRTHIKNVAARIERATWQTARPGKA